MRKKNVLKFICNIFIGNYETVGVGLEFELSHPIVLHFLDCENYKLITRHDKSDMTQVTQHDSHDMT